MRLFTDLNQVVDMENSVIAFGNFDGVHKGHQELIRRTINCAVSTKLKSVVFTFSNHPKNILAEKLVVKNILPFDEKIKIIKELGIDYIVTVPFDDTIRYMKPEHFIVDILVKKLKMKEAYCGFNYRFGLNGTGTPETLMRVGLAKGFGIHILEPYMVHGEVVSSTLIRRYIQDGHVNRCLSLMGHHYSTQGVVMKGNRFGRTLGFPTLNITIDEDMINPANGVYVTYCNYNGIRYPSITNVGKRPTVCDSEARNIETHIFNFDKEIYGKEIRVEFLERLRPEMAFENVEALAMQIKDDCLTAAGYHGIISR
ncbi:MAG TPA: bifunctional riboflavin kinase/FAD synthetase [Anaerovoracaceae bacterium]|nr:bifunctional riboflavin kinase/FAD synthetase [Anaerovoracaceae bacterium]